jgi:hypothetical protein
MIRSKQHYGDYRWQTSVADFDLGTDGGRIVQLGQYLQKMTRSAAYVATPQTTML